MKCGNTLILLPGKENFELTAEFEQFNDRIVKCTLKDEFLSYNEKSDGIAKFVGIAKLHPYDTFDLRTGRRLALNKALVKRCNTYVRIEQMMILELDTMLHYGTKSLEKKWGTSLN